MEFSADACNGNESGGGKKCCNHADGDHAGEIPDVAMKSSSTVMSTSSAEGAISTAD
jgi:hypothetical protein